MHTTTISPPTLVPELPALPAGDALVYPRIMSTDLDVLSCKIQGAYPPGRAGSDGAKPVNMP
jgi:hypothetical protein